MYKQGGLCYRSCSKINMIDCSIDSCVTKPDFCYLITNPTKSLTQNVY
jgi:hypothetical protein